MFKTPYKAGRTPSKASTTPKKGLFEDGQWLCDCTPRQPALCQTVRKEGRNKGKRFWTCQDRKCEMFLWEDAAKTREQQAVLLHNCRSENGITGRIRPKTPEPAPPLNLSRSAGPKLTDGKITDYAARQPKPAKPQQKQQQRIFKSLEESRDTYLSDPSDSDETNELASLADKATPQPSPEQNRQRSYLSQPGQVNEISQTLRGESSSRPPGPGATAAETGRSSAFNFQAQPSRPAPVTPTAKRKRDVFLEGGGSTSSDEFGGGDLDDSDTERQLAQITDESARKQQRTRNVYETPSAQRTIDDGIRSDLGLPTPVSRRPGLLVASEERERRAKRQRLADATSSSPVDAADEEEEEEPRFRSDAVGDPATPTPYRKADALAPPPAAAAGARARSPAGPTGADDYPKIAEEVLSFLSSQPVSESTKRTLRAAMERHEMRVKGVARGRDAARAGIAERDERIAELQARVVNLENTRKLDRQRLRELSEFGERLMRLSQDE